MPKEPKLADLAREIATLREEIQRLKIPNNPVVDPPPFWGGRFVDPAPNEWRRWPERWPERWPIPIPQPGDPAPFDRARFRVALGLDLREVSARILSKTPKEVTLDLVDKLYVGDVIGVEPGPVVDPAPDDVGRWVRIDPRYIPLPYPGDPPPFDLSRLRAVPNVKLVEAVAKIRGTSAGKVKVQDLARVTVRDLIQDLIDGGQVDPPPIDFGRFAALTRAGRSATEFSVREISAMNAAELEATSHRLNGEITRLEALRELVEKRKGSVGEGS